MEMNEITLGSKKIGPGHPPLIVAEMSGNHNQSLEKALQIVNAAAKAGAQALKLQTYTAETMTLNIREGDFYINDKKSLWTGHSLYELYQKAHTPWEWHKPIFDRCKELGMLCFSTPFDTTALEFLEDLDAPFYKLASFENIDLPLIRKIAATGKPMIASTGMATLAELDDLVTTAKNAGCKDLILLHCTSSYPSTPKDSNLATIPHLRDLFKVQVGLSDHTLGIGVAVASVALGATLIEKHFTLSRAEGGVDAAFSLEPHELKALVEESHRAWEAVGHISYGPTEAEKKSMYFRRTLYVVKDIKAGDVLNSENLRAIRPGSGLSPKFFETVIGKKVNKDTKRGTPLSWDLIG
jgi:N-acetylneuraminate synthase